MSFTKNHPVIIEKDQLGNVVRQSANPEYGYILLSQARVFLKNGWINEKKHTTLIKGKIDTLKSMGFDLLTTLPGNIIVYESTEPVDSMNTSRNLKIAGDTGIILCTKDGEPIYRQTKYDPTGLESDVLLEHQAFNKPATNTKTNTVTKDEPVVAKKTFVKKIVDVLNSVDESDDENTIEISEDVDIEINIFNNEDEDSEIEEFEDEFTFDIE